MGELYDEFERTLSEWRELYRDEPRRELEQLLLLALEREQLVTVAYRNDLMASRLDELKLSSDWKRVLRQSLAWAWKDEQMHAIYTRGVLLRSGRLSLRIRALVQQLAGTVGGWASSVSQHAPWSKAPFSRTVASLLSAAGRLAGKVPRGVRRKLRHLSLREFSLLQVDAERTAAACWKRLFELSRERSLADEETMSAFERMWHDERNHERVFALVADALESGRETVDASELARRIRGVDEFFVPREHRSGALARHPLGAGGKVVSLKGSESTSPASALAEAVERAGLEDVVRRKATTLGKPIEELTVLLKPTFMLGYHRKDTTVITDPELVLALARFLRELGCRDVIVGEGRNIYDAFFDRRSVHQVASYFGYDSELYRIVDLTEEQVPHRYGLGMGQHTISRSWRDADVRIVFSKLRSHPVDLAHLSIGGLQGVGARLEDFLFFERRAHRDTALLMPLVEHPPDFALIDGYRSAADGLVGIISCPRPARPLRLYAGADALAVDLIAAVHMGLSQPRDSLLLDAACHWFSDPTQRIEVVGCDEPIEGWRGPLHNELSSLLSLVANPVYQFASGRGAVFLPQMDEEAFPRKTRGTASERAQRFFVRKLLGMELPR
jgi:uncharacterized protein (DUF362 family)